MVSIPPFQVGDSGSIPDIRNDFFHTIMKKMKNKIDTVISYT